MCAASDQVEGSYTGPAEYETHLHLALEDMLLTALSEFLMRLSLDGTCTLQ